MKMKNKLSSAEVVMALKGLMFHKQYFFTFRIARCLLEMGPFLLRIPHPDPSIPQHEQTGRPCPDSTVTLAERQSQVRLCGYYGNSSRGAAGV